MSSNIDPLPLPSHQTQQSQQSPGSVSEQLANAKRRLGLWENSWQQAKNACEAWRKEVDESSKKMRDMEQEMEKIKLEKSKVSTACVSSFLSNCTTVVANSILRNPRSLYARLLRPRTLINCVHNPYAVVARTLSALMFHVKGSSLSHFSGFQ